MTLHSHTETFQIHLLLPASSYLSHSSSSSSSSHPMMSALSSTSTCHVPKPSAVASSLFSSRAPRQLIFLSSPRRNLNSKTLKAQAAESQETSPSKEITQNVKRTSILCHSCEGNGVKLCSQCEGSGVNKEDHFNGRFKKGGLCWLCRGKREILCGECNGAGFLGGFLSTLDETAT